MLETIFGNATIEKVLLYLQNYNEGYASEIASTFSVSLSVVQKQLKRLEDGGVIVSQLKGRTRIFLWNDKQNLDQSLMIAKKHPIKIKAIESWSKNEGETEKFEIFRKRLSLTKK